VHLVFDIFQGIGIAAALGIRPFLPALATGALAVGDIQINFDHTDYSFLESAPFLLIVAVAAIGLGLLERRAPAAEEGRRSPVVLALGAVALVLGALFFAGALAQDRYTVWPGWLAGVICALIAVAATLPLLARVRARLDASSVGSLPFFTEIAAVLLAVLSVLAPPVGPIALAFLLWLLFAGRRREGQKYAGLRILR
jgi:uncharacterized membrane protein YgdD (TMEM256/DUF423 family)